MIYFIHIPRTGGGSLTKAIEDNNANIKRIGHNTYNPKWKSANDILEEEQGAEFFTILRNPYDRIISVYKALKFNPGTSDMEFYKKYMKKYNNINEFVDDLDFLIKNTNNPHIKPQTFFIPMEESIGIFFYEKMEMLKEFLDIFDSNIFNSFKSAKRHLSPKKDIQLNEESKKKIAKIYEIDFAFGGYQK